MTKRMNGLLATVTLLVSVAATASAAPSSSPGPGPDQNPRPPVEPPVFACGNKVCGIQVVTESESLWNGPNEGVYSLRAVARCPFGKYAISGGFAMGGNFNQIAVTRNAPYFATDGDGEILDPLPIGWEASSIRLTDDWLNAGWDIQVWAICATIK